jgi:hypothetical protein
MPPGLELGAAHQEIEIIADALLSESAMIKRFPALRKT